MWPITTHHITWTLCNQSMMPIKFLTAYDCQSGRRGLRGMQEPPANRSREETLLTLWDDVENHLLLNTSKTEDVMIRLLQDMQACCWETEVLWCEQDPNYHTIHLMCKYLPMCNMVILFMYSTVLKYIGTATFLFFLKSLLYYLFLLWMLFS